MIDLLVLIVIGIFALMGLAAVLTAFLNWVADLVCKHF